ncbi:MAG: cysteine methyltransferase [Syntrophus sp. (in: bacteria)]|nr:cysteine methyltransferase [Syntrophus sp. (in: bacteria)]
MGSPDMTTPYVYEQIPSDFGAIGLVWVLGKGDPDPLLRRILLPLEGVETKTAIMTLFPGAVERSDAVFAPISRQIRRFLEGEAVDFSLHALDLKACGAFQQRVLHLEFQIPRGKVSAYGALAHRLGLPRAGRAVGTALARNPFPIVIPCHRAIRGDRTLGGFGGGLKMKRALLEMEGVGFDRKNRVQKSHFLP